MKIHIEKCNEKGTQQEVYTLDVYNQFFFSKIFYLVKWSLVETINLPQKNLCKTTKIK